jgi:hypothetical protein
MAGILEHLGFAVGADSVNRQAHRYAHSGRLRDDPLADAGALPGASGT